MTTSSVYTYIHCKPDGTPFYVGKGKLCRAYSLQPRHRNNYHGKTVSKYGKENILISVMECSKEQIAFDLEIGLIKCFKRMGLKLTNMTNGGEGTSGVIRSLKSRQQMSIRMKGRKASESAKHNMSIAQSKRKHPEEVKIKIGLSGKGRKNTHETLLKMSKSQIGHVGFNCKKIKGIHVEHGTMFWESGHHADRYFGVALSTVGKALRKRNSYNGWKLEFVT